MHDKEIWVEFSEDADIDYKQLQKKVLQEKKQGMENSSHMQLLKSIDREKDNIKIIFLLIILILVLVVL